MLNIILSALPALGSLIAGGKGHEVVAAGAKIAQEVFGSTDEKQVLEKMAADPSLAESFKAKLAAETEALRIESRNFEIQTQDTANAREVNARLAEAGSGIAWSGPVLDTVIVVGFFMTVYLIALRPVPMDQTQFTVLNVLLGALTAAFMQVVNYHRGSSAGSAAKDRVIQNIGSDNTTTAAKVAAKVVEAAAKKL